MNMAYGPRYGDFIAIKLYQFCKSLFPNMSTNRKDHYIAGLSIDLLSRMMSMQKAHPSYAMTGAMCTAAAAVIPGSIVNQVISPDTDTQYIRIGHPSGVLECGVDYLENGTCPVIKDTFGFRTANFLLDGNAHLSFF